MDAVIFLFRYHRLMLSRIVLIAALGIFKPTVIKGLSEHSIDHALCEGFTAHFATLAGTKPPLCVSDFKNLRRAIEARGMVACSARARRGSARGGGHRQPEEVVCTLTPTGSLRLLLRRWWLVGASLCLRR